MREIAVPRLNGNDDTCTLVEWSCVDGATIEDQAALAVLETAKASTEIYSESPGIVLATVEAGAECRVGDVIGYVCADSEERDRLLKSRAPANGHTEGSALTLTDAARRLSERHGVTDDQLRSLGKLVIRESDLQALLRERAPAETLSPRQRAIAKVVSRSHSTVADAFTAVKVYCDELLDRLHDVNAAGDSMVGLPEAAIAVLAGLKPAFPTFFGWLADDDRLELAGERTDIGVTIDVGTGLFVPVVKDVGGRSAGEIADRLMELRVKALRESFTEEDLSGGQLTVSLNADDGVLFAVPIVLAPQVCVVSIGSTQTELVLDERGEVRQRRHVTVGLSYDHRVVNGADAVRFLTAFKSVVERPGEVAL